MDNLEKITIGEKGFTEYRNWYTTPDKARDAHFTCTNNPQLTCLTIGCYSFFDYSEFKLESN